MERIIYINTSCVIPVQNSSDIIFNNSWDYVWCLRCHQSLFRDLSADHRSIGGFVGDGEGILHISRLFQSEISQSASGDNESTSRYEKAERIISKLSRKFDDLPVVARLLSAVLSVLFLFFCSFLGCWNVDNNRRLRGALWICAGSIEFCIVVGWLGMHVFRN